MVCPSTGESRTREQIAIGARPANKFHRSTSLISNSFHLRSTYIDGGGVAAISWEMMRGWCPRADQPASLPRPGKASGSCRPRL